MWRPAPPHATVRYVRMSGPSVFDPSLWLVSCDTVPCDDDVRAGRGFAGSPKRQLTRSSILVKIAPCVGSECHGWFSPRGVTGARRPRVVGRLPHSVERDPADCSGDEPPLA